MPMKNSSSQFVSGTHLAWRPWLVCLFLIIMTLAAYAPVRHHDFVNFDDGVYVYSNQQVQNGLTIDSIRWAFTLIKSDEVSYWHPVTWLSHMLDCQLFGVDPEWHHLSNLFFHLSNVVLLFLLLFRMTGEIWKSATVAALFALHPMNVDSVAWIAERKNLLSTTFWMLTMIAYIRYAARPSAWRYSIMMLVFALGLMAKPMLVTLPCALLLLDFWPLYRFEWFRKNWLNKKASPIAVVPAFHVTSVNRLILEKIPPLVLSFAAIQLSFISLQKNSQILNEIIQPYSLRISNALVSYLHYLWKIIWPANLAVFYPFPSDIPIWQPVAAAIALISLTSLIVIYSRQKPYLATGWFWYVGTLTPVIGIIQGGLWPQIADRWVYIPYIGIFIILAWGVPDILSRVHSKRTVLMGLSIASLMLLFTLTSSQLKHWKNTKTLFQHTLDVTQNNYYAHVALGRCFLKEDDHVQAMAHFQKALDILPYYVSAIEAIGEEYVFQKDYEKAFQYYQKAILLNPLNNQLFNKIGNLYLSTKQYDKAIKHYREAAAIDPYDPMAYNNLGAAYIFTDHIESAIQNLKKAIELKPDYAEAYYNLGLAAEKSGNADRAAIHFQKSVALNPDYAEAHNSLAKIFFQDGNLPQALQHFKQVARLSPEDAPARYNIGVIFYMRQQMAEAARNFQKALEIDPDYEKAKVALQLAIEMMEKNPE